MLTFLWPRSKEESSSPPPPSTFSELPGASLQKPNASPKIRRRKVKPIPGVELVPGLVSLRGVIQACPPKILHSWILDRLDPDSQVAFPTLEADMPTISALFSGLEPPQAKHCARCHLDYHDVDNGPRSCVMEHDDESAVVVRSVQGLHETTYHCCGQTVDGDGDLGPPAGWCYEGLHTSDRLEAGYREDAVEDDDKLEDCAKRRCGEEVKHKRRPKRSRGTAKLDSDAEEERNAMDLSRLKPRAKHTRKASDIEARSKSRSRMQAAQTDTEIDDPKPKPVPAKPKAPITKTKGSIPSKIVENGKSPEKSREGRSDAQEKAATAATLATKPRGRPKKVQEETPAPGFKVPAPKAGPSAKKRKLNAE